MNRLRHILRYALPVSAYVVLLGCQPASETADSGVQLRPVRTLVVQQTDASGEFEFTGVVDASKKVDLAFKIAGEIIDLPLNTGDEVVAGQLIARLDDKDIRIELQEAQSSFDKAKADFDRAKGLITSNSVSRSEFDRLKAEYNSFAAQLESAKNKLEYTRLTASFSGVIAKKFVENFQEVNAKERVVALHDLNNINFNIEVPETIMINVQRDRTPPKVWAVFDAIPDTQFPLTFKEVSTEADSVTKNFQVTFSMPSPKGHNILPGMSARVRVEKLPILEPVASIYVPAHAVLKAQDGHFVYTVTSVDDVAGKVVKQPVVIGDITARGIAVFSGLQEGQHLLVAGMSKVSDGMLVKFQSKE